MFNLFLPRDTIYTVKTLVYQKIIIYNKTANTHFYRSSCKTLVTRGCIIFASYTSQYNIGKINPNISPNEYNGLFKN